MAEGSSLICTNAIDLTKHITKHNLVYQIPHKVSSLSIPLVCPKTQPLKKNLFIIYFYYPLCNLMRLKTGNWATTLPTKEKQGNKLNIQQRSIPQGSINFRKANPNTEQWRKQQVNFKILIKQRKKKKKDEPASFPTFCFCYQWITPVFKLT